MSYIQIEEGLRIKKIKFTKFLSELDLQLAKEKKGMMDNNGEILNNNNISKESNLYITLLEARNLPSANFQGLSDPYVVLSFEGQKFKSAYKQNTLDPVWNENFVFQPTTKSSIINIEIWSKGNIYSGDTLLGKTEVFIENHMDQKKTLLNLELNYNNTLKNNTYKNKLIPVKDFTTTSLNNFDNLEITINPTILINLQFIWNKLKYYTDNFNSIEKKIELVRKHIEELNYYCENFQRPFGLIIYGELTSILERKILEKDEDLMNVIDENKNKMKMLMSPRQTNTRYTFSNKLQNVIKSTFKSHIKWNSLSKSMMFLIIMLSLLSFYERPDFLNLTIGIISYILLMNNKSENAINSMIKFMNILLLSIIFDFIWIIIFKHNLFESGLEFKTSKFSKGLVFLIGILNLICKIILTICIFILISQNKNSHGKSGLIINNSVVSTVNKTSEDMFKNKSYPQAGPNVNNNISNGNPGNPFKSSK